jgi:AI-2E family transporter
VEPWKAAVLLVFVLVYQQVESNLLQPLVYSQAVQLNGLIILVALLVGGQLLGIPGALLAIPVAEIIRILITELVAYRRKTQGGTSPPSRPPRHRLHPSEDLKCNEIQSAANFALRRSKQYATRSRHRKYAI